MIDALGQPRSLLLLGGTSDIAVAIAREYASRQPLTVHVAARPSPRRDAVVEELEALGSTVYAQDFEAREPQSHADLVAAVAEHGDVDVAVLAFGVLGDPEAAWQDVDAALDLVETNYVASVSCGVALARQVRSQGHGVMVALSSVAGERPRRSNFVYGSTKAGMDSFFTGLGEAVREDGGRVLVVRPGFVRSKMRQGLRAAPLSVTPEEVARAAVRAVAARDEQIWVPGALRFVMSGLRHLPRPVFRRLPI